jgi:hypothetical protein
MTAAQLESEARSAIEADVTALNEMAQRVASQDLGLDDRLASAFWMYVRVCACCVLRGVHIDHSALTKSTSLTLASEGVSVSAAEVEHAVATGSKLVALKGLVVAATTHPDVRRMAYRVEFTAH